MMVCKIAVLFVAQNFSWGAQVGCDLQITKTIAYIAYIALHLSITKPVT